MLAALGNGWMNTIAVLFFLLCSLIVPFFIKYGHKYRPSPPAGFSNPAASIVPPVQQTEEPFLIKVEDEGDEQLRN